MRPDKQSTSFTFHRNIFGNSNNPEIRMHNCRRKLQDKFEDGDIHTSTPNSEKNRSALLPLNLNDTRKMLLEGAERISRTFSNIRTTLGSFSQRFRTVTKRRQILEEGPMTPGSATPQTFSRRILGRTPTKLYSPFSIESPYNATTTAIDIKTGVNNR